MCLAIPGKIIEINGEDAIVVYGKERRNARLINSEIKVGDYVVVQNKLILQKVPSKQAHEAIKLWKTVFENED
jgi:hydrogenase expression/formation protein HypC